MAIDEMLFDWKLVDDIDILQVVINAGGQQCVISFFASELDAREWGVLESADP